MICVVMLTFLDKHDSWGAFSCAGARWRLAGDAFISQQAPAGAGATERAPVYARVL